MGVVRMGVVRMSVVRMAECSLVGSMEHENLDTGYLQLKDRPRNM